jgi:hypothetical protein
MMATKKSYISGWRGANIPIYLKKLAIHCNLEIDLDVDKDWLEETVFFTVEGDDEKIASFFGKLSKSVEEYGDR